MSVENRGMVIMIAGKTESEILSMGYQKRYLWYKMILPEEKEKAMGIVEIVRRCKLSAANIGENNPNFGKIPSEESNIKRRMAWTSEMREKERAARVGENNSRYGVSPSEETRVKQSAAMSGENNPNFNNWSSRAPYCRLWDEPLRERYRNYWGRRCVLSDMLRSVLGPESHLNDFEGHEIFSRRRLSVHHIRGDKMEGCNGNEMSLVPLQCRFNNKKFDDLRLEDHPFYITLFLLKDIERKHREEMLRE